MRKRVSQEYPLQITEYGPQDTPLWGTILVQHDSEPHVINEFPEVLGSIRTREPEVDQSTALTYIGVERDWGASEYAHTFARRKVEAHQNCIRVKILEVIAMERAILDSNRPHFKWGNFEEGPLRALYPFDQPVPREVDLKNHHYNAERIIEKHLDELQPGQFFIDCHTMWPNEPKRKVPNPLTPKPLKDNVSETKHINEAHGITNYINAVIEGVLSGVPRPELDIMTALTKDGPFITNHNLGHIILDKFRTHNIITEFNQPYPLGHEICSSIWTRRLIDRGVIPIIIDLSKKLLSSTQVGFDVAEPTIDEDRIHRAVTPLLEGVNEFEATQLEV